MAIVLPNRIIAAESLNRHASWEMGANAPPPFSPTQLTNLGAWFSFPDSTLVSGDISSVPDSINANPLVQSVPGRRPTLEASPGNGMLCARFTTNDALVWPIIAAVEGLHQWGLGFWMKSSDLSSIGMLFSAFSGTNGASAPRQRLYTQSTGVTCETYASGSDGRFCNKGSVLSTSAFAFLTLEYDDSAGTEALRTTITVNAAVQTLSFGNQGSGATTGALVDVTGNFILGDVGDGAAVLPYSGLVGPDLWQFNGKTAGATTGLLSATERTNLMNYRKPT